MSSESERDGVPVLIPMEDRTPLHVLRLNKEPGREYVDLERYLNTDNDRPEAR